MSQVQQAFHVVSQELGRTVNQARVMLEEVADRIERELKSAEVDQ